VKLRTRLAVVVAMLLFVLGAAAGISQANAAPRETITTSSTNGCVVVPPLKLAACLGRF